MNQQNDLLPFESWQKAVEEFNTGSFFACHETLEAYWLITPLPEDKRFLQGMIQAAAAFEKLTRFKNSKGANQLLSYALNKLQASFDQAKDPRQKKQYPYLKLLDLSAFIQALIKFKTGLTPETEPEDIEKFKLADFPKIRLNTEI